LSSKDININEVELPKNSESVYTIEWKWEPSDEAYQLMKKDDVTYTVYLEVYSKEEGN
jgi:hypothetical protein